jgi:hypothetical protein
MVTIERLNQQFAGCTGVEFVKIGELIVCQSAGPGLATIPP